MVLTPTILMSKVGTVFLRHSLSWVSTEFQTRTPISVSTIQSLSLPLVLSLSSQSCSSQFLLDLMESSPVKYSPHLPRSMLNPQTDFWASSHTGSSLAPDLTKSNYFSSLYLLPYLLTLLSPSPYVMA